MAHAKTPATPDSLLVSRAEARALLGVGTATFEALLKDGAFPVIRYGKRGVRIRRVDLEQYVENAIAPWAG